MADFFLEILTFAIKTLIIVLIFTGPVFLILGAIAKHKQQDTITKGRLVVEDLKLQARKRSKFMRKHLKQSNPERELQLAEVKAGLAEEKDCSELQEEAEKSKQPKFSFKLLMAWFVGLFSKGDKKSESKDEVKATCEVKEQAKSKEAAKPAESTEATEPVAEAKVAEVKAEDKAEEVKVETQSEEVKAEETKAEDAQAATEDNKADAKRSASEDIDAYLEDCKEKALEQLGKDVAAELDEIYAQQKAQSAAASPTTEDKPAAKVDETKFEEVKVEETKAEEVKSEEVKTDAKAEEIPQDILAAALRENLVESTEKAAEQAEQNASACPFGFSKAKKQAELLAKAVRLRKERDELLETIAAKEAAGEFCPENLFVIDFVGTVKGREFASLRRKIDALLEVATSKDEVIVNLNSPGGLVNTYGLCAAQLQRLRERNIPLTVTVDEVAASGGYLMACVANKIVAAPFAYIGSIGVIAGIPNFRKVLNRYDVDYEQVTAGKYKRTLTMFGENTTEGRKKFQEELEAVHKRFKEQVLMYRPDVDIAKIATGEHWLASDAKELGLVDEIATSDEYIRSRMAVTSKSALKLVWKKQKSTNPLQKLIPKFKFERSISSAKQQLEELEQSSFMQLK